MTLVQPNGDFVETKVSAYVSREDGRERDPRSCGRSIRIDHHQSRFCRPAPKDRAGIGNHAEQPNDPRRCPRSETARLFLMSIPYHVRLRRRVICIVKPKSMGKAETWIQRRLSESSVPL